MAKSYEIISERPFSDKDGEGNIYTGVLYQVVFTSGSITETHGYFVKDGESKEEILTAALELIKEDEQ